MPEASYGRSNRWLTVILITPEEFGADREAVRLALESEDIEARPMWKPMHLQPVFRSADYADYTDSKDYEDKKIYLCRLAIFQALSSCPRLPMGGRTAG